MLLVTGGAGYIGSHFVHMYKRRFAGEPIVIVDNLSTGHRESLPVSSDLLFHQVDIGDQDSMLEIFERHHIDMVVHFASSACVGESQKDPFKYLQNNVVNSINLFHAMQKSGISKLVFSSTCASYGNPQYTPIDEVHPQNPVNTYGLTKFIVEKTLNALSESQGWSYVALRYFNAAGAAISGGIGESHQPETHLLPLVLQAAKERVSAVTVNGNDYDTTDGTCIRDYIHVDDLAIAHLDAIDYLNRGNQSICVNLGSAIGTSVLEIIEACRLVTGSPIEMTFAPRRSGDPSALVANFSKASELLDWTPKQDLQSIVDSAWNWELNRTY